MYRIFELLVRYREYAATVFLTIVSLLLISGSGDQRIRNFRTLSVGILASVQSAFNWIPNPWELETENRALRRLNRDLSVEATRLRDAGVKVESLREMLSFREQSDADLVAAEVVGKPTLQLRNYITIDRGRSDDLEEGMPVITPAGLVGRIVGLNDDYSIVLLIINADSRIAGRTLSSRATGIVRWDKEEQLLLENVPSVVSQRVGDTVLTSGLSSVFPQDMVIGTIGRVEEEQGTLYHRLTVTPTVDFSTLEEVFVVRFMPDLARLAFERQFLDRVSQGRPEGNE